LRSSWGEHRQEFVLSPVGFEQRIERVVQPVFRVAQAKERPHVATSSSGSTGSTT
jgi:hypothetical protein